MSARLLSIAEAAKRLSLSRISVYRWAESGRIPSVKLGSRRLIPEAAIDGIVRDALENGEFRA
jgi:excisionase family DNA binding protein